MEGRGKSEEKSMRSRSCGIACLARDPGAVRALENFWPDLIIFEDLVVNGFDQLASMLRHLARLLC